MNRNVRPLHYELLLDVDLAGRRFDGEVSVFMRVEREVREVLLDMVDLTIHRSALFTRDRKEDCSFRVEPDEQGLRLFLPREIRGEAELTIEFSGVLNERMAGFYLSRYRSGGSEGVLAVTQFEETEARRAFPCFDHPSMKATFGVRILADPGLVAVSNTPAEEESPGPGGKTLVRFSRTPTMSTYLLFFGVGPFEIREDPGRVRVRALSAPGRIERSGLAVDFGRKSLDYMERYTGIPFPIPKLDLIAVPDFAFGAMENWGAMTFRENLLLKDPEATSRAGEERICEVIAHETAHQWFGNLVTPEDWNDLWLNESFATFFGYRVLDYYHPEWEVWDRFINGQVRSALERDALTKTHAVEIPPGRPVVINASTAPIIYSKGGAVLRHLHDYMGEERFRNGVRAYLSESAYGCATSRAAWEALDRASEQPVRTVIGSWMEQPGFPLLEVECEGRGVTLRQERFTYLDEPSSALWRIPLALVVFLEGGDTLVRETLLEGRSAVIDLGAEAAACLANPGRSGFYRIRYLDERNLEALGGRVASRTLAPADRWGLQDDLYALVAAGKEPLSRYMDFLSWYQEERDYLPAAGIGDRLVHASLVCGGAPAEKAAMTGREFLEGVLERVGMEPAGGESLGAARLRDDLLWKAALLGSGKALDWGLEKFSFLCSGGKIHPDILGSVLRIGALRAGRRGFDWIMDRLARSESEFERMELLGAAGCFSEVGLVDEALDHVLEKVPDRNKFVPVSRMAENPYAVPRLWDWYKAEHERISAFHPLHHERIITYVVPVGGLGREQEVRAFFDGPGRVPPRSREVVEISLERLEVNLLMRRRALGRP